MGDIDWCVTLRRDCWGCGCLRITLLYRLAERTVLQMSVQYLRNHLWHLGQDFLELLTLALLYSVFFERVISSIPFLTSGEMVPYSPELFSTEGTV